MTVPVQNPVANHIGNGVTTAFAFGFKLLDEGDIAVTIDGITRTLGLDYSVSGVDVEAGGTVTFNTAPASLSQISLVRQVTINRTTDYQYSGDFEADTVNRDFDRIVMMMQDSELSLAAAVRMPPGDASSGLLPSAATRSLKNLGFDASGNITLVPTTAGDASALALELASSTLPTQGAGMLGYRLNAIGSVGRDLALKLAERVSVKDFGAVGDGISNDTAAFSLAVAHLNSVGGGILEVPRGQYKVGPVTLAFAGIRIRGAGREATQIMATTNSVCFEFSLFGGQEWGVEDLSIHYTGDQTAGVAIKADGGGSATVNGCIRNVYIERCFNGISLGNSQATVIDGLQIWYFTGSGLVFTGNLNDVYIRNVFLNGAQFTSPSTPNAASVGIDVSGKAHAMMASGVEIIQCFRPMQLIGGADTVQRPAFSTFTDCFFDSSLAPVRLANTRDLKFLGCWFSQRADGCLVDVGAIGTTFIGSSFTNNNGTGCVVQSSAKHTRFVDCTFDSNGQTSSAGGLIIDASVTDVKVLGGVAGNLGGFPATQQNGITILAGIDRIKIDGMTFSGNASVPIAFADAAAANALTDFQITNCPGFATRNKGASTILSAGTSVVVNHGLAYAPTPTDLTLTDWNGNPARTYLDTTTIGTTQFTIRTSAAPGSDMAVGWSARCFNG